MQPRLLLPLAAGLTLLAGCGCPPLVTDYSSPTGTLATWQAHLCHDDVDGEYRCFSTDFKRGTGHFETYYAARNELLDSEPLLAAALSRLELTEHIVEEQLDEATGRALQVLDLGGRRTTIGFVRETALLLEFDEGPPFVAHSRLPLSSLLLRPVPGNRQWIELSQFTPLPTQRLADARAVLLERRWKIDAIEGLVPDPGVAP